MASIAIAAAVVGAAGQAISAISKANALRQESRLRQLEGEQELATSKKQLRQELGLRAVEAGASGLLGSSFANVFESQAIEDASFLGRIKQRTDFDVASLKSAARSTLISGLISAGASAAGGIASAKSSQAQLKFATGSASRQLEQRAAQRRTGNIFTSSAPTSTGPFGLRRARTASFF